MSFFREFQNRKSIVRLKCAEGKKDTATFKVIDEDNWVSEDKNNLKSPSVTMPYVREMFMKN